MRFRDDINDTDIFIALIFFIITAYFTYLLIKNINRNKIKKVSNVSNSKSDNSNIPKNTLKLIQN